MTKISWNETIPSITSKVGDFPRYAQSVWTAISNAFAGSNSLYWDGSGGFSANSRGELAAGASRPFFDVQSNSSAPNSQMTARAFLASDTTRLLAYESAATYLVGTPSLVEMATDGGAGAWYSYSSQSNLGSVTSSTFTFTFPTVYGAVPQMLYSVGNNCAVSTSVLTTGGFVSLVSVTGGASGIVLTWRSLGTISQW